MLEHKFNFFLRLNTMYIYKFHVYKREEKHLQVYLCYFPTYNNEEILNIMLN